MTLLLTPLIILVLLGWWALLTFLEQRRDPGPDWAQVALGYPPALSAPPVRALERLVGQVWTGLKWGLFLAGAVLLTWLVKGQG